jgi:hypothetical protein
MKIVKITVLAIIVCFSASVNATPVNWNSVEVNDIEYYMQTDKAIYNLGENVEMLYKVTNLSNANVMFGFGGDPEWNFWVEKDGDYVWQAVEGWWASGTGFTLAPSESKEYTYTWDMKDYSDVLVSLGEYKAIGGFDAGVAYKYEYSKVAVPINIIPEPATFILFGFGVFLLRKRK